MLETLKRGKPSQIVHIIMQFNCFQWFIQFICFKRVYLLNCCQLTYLYLIYLIYMQMQFSDFISHRYSHAYCLTMLIVFSMYFKGIECSVGCVCESVNACGLIIWGVICLDIFALISVLFYSSFILGWSELGVN